MSLRLAAILLLALTGPAAAAPTCHCFRARAYDAADPAAADPYVLATARTP